MKYLNISKLANRSSKEIRYQKKKNVSTYGGTDLRMLYDKTLRPID